MNDLNNYIDDANEILNKNSFSEKLLIETPFNGIWEELKDDQRNVGIISSYLKNEENEKRSKEFIKDIKNMGYGYIVLKVECVEENIEKILFFIPSINKEDAIELAKKYDQNSIIYKDKNSIQQIKCDNKEITHIFTNDFENIKGKKELIKEFFKILTGISSKNVFKIQESLSVFKMYRKRDWILNNPGKHVKANWITIFKD